MQMSGKLRWARNRVVQRASPLPCGSFRIMQFQSSLVVVFPPNMQHGLTCDLPRSEFGSIATSKFDIACHRLHLAIQFTQQRLGFQVQTHAGVAQRTRVGAVRIRIGLHVSGHIQHGTGG